MTQATEQDLGPLTWVKSEIDQALAQALSAIDKAAASDEERSSHLQFAQSHLHQARGALSIIGLDGLTQFTDGLDKLLGDLARGERELNDDVVDLCRRAIAATGNYLDELSHGAPDQPLRLAALHARIAVARGVDAPTEGDLFFPPADVRIPRRAEPPALGNDDEQRLLRWLRVQFQQGLLNWIRKPDDPAGARQMRESVAGIESRQRQQAARGFWLSAAAFCEVLAEGHVPVTPHIRRICARIDAQIRRLVSGTTHFPERLHRDTMYIVAKAPATAPLIKALHSLYRLPAQLPPPNSAISELPLAPMLADLREQLNHAKDAWDQFAEGTAAALPSFEERMVRLASASRKLGRPAVVRLMTTLSAFAQWLRKDPMRVNDAISMEVASALLLADHALDSGRVPDASFSTQVEDCIARIEACSRGEAVSNQDASASARQAQERSAVAQLCKEMQASLAQVEQTLDGFFRAPDNREPLKAVKAPIQQIEGILTLLEEQDAYDTLSDSEAIIDRLADPEQPIDTALFEPLADLLSSLGFYIDSLARGRPDKSQLTGEHDAPEPEYVDVELPATQAETLPETAVSLPPEAAALPTAPPRDREARIEHEEDLPEQPVPVPETSAEAAQLLEASEEEIDAELLDIFIEEAREVLTDIERNLGAVRANPADQDALTTVRRGFHTLKGSGRMVGLNALGEVAWDLEQTLNRWLQLEWSPNATLLDLIGDAHTLFAAWVEQLAGGGATGRDDSAPVSTQAKRLLTATSPDDLGPAPIETPAPESVLPVDEAEEVETDSADASVEAEEHPVGEAALEPDAAAMNVTDLEATDLAFDLSVDLPELDDTPADSALERTLIEPLEALETPDELDAVSLDFPELEDEAPPADEDEVPEPIELPELGADVLTEPTALDTAATPDAAVAGEAAEPEPDAMAEAADTAPEAVETEIAAEESDTVELGTLTLSRPLFDLYCNESRDHLTVLREEASQLEINPTRVPEETAVRAAHTLAGISGTAGLDPVQTLARALEHALARLQETATAPSAEQAALIKTTVTTLDAMLREVGDTTFPLAAPVLEAQLDSLQRTPIAPEPAPADDENEATADAVAPIDAAPAADFDATPMPTEPASTDIVTPTEEAAEPETLDVQDDIDEQLLPIFVEEGQDLMAQLNAALRDWRGDMANPAHRGNVARLLHTIKGSARMTGAMTLGEHLHALEGRLEAASDTTPTLLDELEQGLDLTSQYIDRLARGDTTPPDEEAPTETTDDAAAPAAVAIETEEAASTGGGTLRVRADLVDRFVNEAGEIGIARTRIEGELRTQRRALLDLTENVIRLRNQLREVEIQADIQMQSRIAQAESQHANFDPLEMDRYTRLQELTRMMAESVNDVTTVQHTLLRNLDQADAALIAQGRQSRTLQQALMSVRMTPFDSLADRLYRVVRQSAKELGKRANLDLRGGRIELDRSVLERITGPLEHLLRNAVAHGIESPEERHASRKPDIGQITLTVRHEGNEVVVEMSDDGAGLDYARIEARAREAGLLADGEQADERRLTNMIFMPGFSTAGELSAVSGRGVGMDVVKAETAAVGGRIEVTSTAGAGSSFRLYLPLTLAVTQTLLVRAAGRTYAIPSNMVAQVLELKPDALETIRTTGTTHWLNDDYAYTYLPRLLGDHETQPEIHRFNWVLLLKSGSQTLAVHVDALRGNQEIVVKKAGPQLARLVGYTGATVLGDGEIVLILNPVALAGVAIDAGMSGAESVTPQTESAHVPTVMVVDDSLTVRKITSRLLEREGYTVVTAKDGVDALEHLLDEMPDVILSDIEMPRMDGFDLARNIRNDERLKHVPIIMITSRLADKHRQYAEQIGVNHYLGKPYQEDELLALIGQYAGATTH
ncbi:response regulator [Nitrogeniibacter mangrovi]|uniref:Chemotaxis protein CheA n=1 Tax=Nitrogeniibacter mangrovi TaxID=2016596 RepID=A0A6C1B002_9RHOO|nr:Hpt domain-containing protein [Nitrogeniibacter mangrovi]QID16897.1 response regulator [Nitrogeniibacter mangrovi]